MNPSKNPTARPSTSHINQYIFNDLPHRLHPELCPRDTDKANERTPAKAIAIVSHETLQLVAPASHQAVSAPAAGVRVALVKPFSGRGQRDAWSNSGRHNIGQFVDDRRETWITGAQRGDGYAQGLAGG